MWSTFNYLFHGFLYLVVILNVYIPYAKLVWLEISERTLPATSQATMCPPSGGRVKQSLIWSEDLFWDILFRSECGVKWPIWNKMTKFRVKWSVKYQTPWIWSKMTKFQAYFFITRIFLNIGGCSQIIEEIYFSYLPRIGIPCPCAYHSNCFLILSMLIVRQRKCEQNTNLYVYLARR